jgi:hypothetical protein
MQTKNANVDMEETKGSTNRTASDYAKIREITEKDH